MLSSIIDKFIPTRKRPVLLGDIYVNGGSDFKKFLEFDSNGENAPEDLKRWIGDFLETAVLSQTQDIDFEFLILDVAVREYRAGTDLGLYADPFIPVLWRPSIKIDVRLRDHKNNSTIGEHSVKQTMGWGEYFSRILSLHAAFRPGSAFTPEDLKLLLAKALMDVLIWAKKRTGSQ